MKTRRATRSAVTWLTILSLIHLLLWQSVLAAGPDLDAPVIKLPSQPQEYNEGEGYRIDATVTDANGLARVVVMVRSDAAKPYQPIPMKQTSSNHYRAIIPPAMTAQSTLDYYIEARDIEGNTSQLPRPSKPKQLAKVKIEANPVAKAPTPKVIVDTPKTEPAETTQTTANINLPELGKQQPANEPQQKTSGGTWKYVLMGVLGAALVAGAAGGSGGGGGDSGNESGTIAGTW